jgi:hypothetical protein
MLMINFKKYLLFPLSTFMGAVFSALVIIGSGMVAIILLSGGVLANLLLVNRSRNIDALGHK